jgi:hypothetical protein
MYQSTWDTLRKKLDIPADKLRRLFGKVQKEAARRAQQIVAARWIKVNEMTRDSQTGSLPSAPSQRGPAHHGGPRRWRGRTGGHTGTVENEARRLR